MKFRKKPVVIEAVKASEALAYAARDWSALPEWLVEAYERGGIVFASDGVHIRTLEGTMLASPGDWIIRGVQGELYPCKPDIFEATYDDAGKDDPVELLKEALLADHTFDLKGWMLRVRDLVEPL